LIQAPGPILEREARGDDLLQLQLRRAALTMLAAAWRASTSSATTKFLRRIAAALRAGSLASALRDLDRAWRCLPGPTPTLAACYGHVLLLQGQDYYAALGLLQRALELGPDPEAAAASALALLRLERGAEARERLHAALSEYCVTPGGLLFHAAGEIALHPSVGAPGWVGRGPRLEILGQLAGTDAAVVLDIAIQGGASFSQLLPRRDAGSARQHFSFSSPAAAPHLPLEIRAHGVPLTGSTLCVPAWFAFDGRATTESGRVTGWARLGWQPARRLRLRLQDETGRRLLTQTGPAGVGGPGLPFSLKAHAAGLRGSVIDIAARLPDGRWRSLPDSPLLLPRAVHAATRVPRPLKRWRASAVPARAARSPVQPARLTDVVVAVYRGREETIACLHSVLGTLDAHARLVVVDDATEDEALAAALDELAADGRITLLRNTVNQGFVASMNRVLSANPSHDVVLLNSDTLVFDDWLPRLRAAAYSDCSVGTVTPLSNAGSIASYPYPGGAEVTPEFAAALHAMARATHAGKSVEIPVGVGFCLYIRYDCRREVGAFDAVFGKGYGEEVDFCLRARRRGFSHRLAADVFVYHAGGVSFGSQRAALLARSQRILNLRHPGYDSFIASFETQDPLHALRRRLDEHRLSAFQERFVLLVSCAMTGGVERFVTERCRDIRAQGLHPLILRPATEGDTRHCELWTDALELPNLRFAIPRELPALRALLGALRLEAIEIQHFLHLDARVIEAVRELPIPYDLFVHDYAWICPRVTLIDGSGRYCGEPAVTACQRCVRRNGSNIGEKIAVPALRARSDAWLRGARHVWAPSLDTATRLQRHFPELEVQVRPHATPKPPEAAVRRPVERALLRIALLGAIGDHKGYAVLLACARDARARGLPLEFVVIGYTRDDAPLFASGKVFVTGRYSEAEAPHLLRREQPDLVWLPSVWPETWCYTLDHALDAGLPVVAYDLGGIAERLRAAGTGELLALDTPARAINDHFLRHLKSGTTVAARAPSFVQSRPPAPCSDDKMSQGPVEISMKNKDEKSMADLRDQGMSASVQVLPLPQGLYLFSVKSASPVTPRSNGELSLPAVHVGLGPGVHPEQVEFIAGPNTHGAWLFAPGDLLVMKVNRAGAMLVMTSVRAPGGDVLSIKVERLEARAEEAGAVAPAVADAVEANPLIPTHERADQAGARPYVPVQIGLHVRSRGDMTFVDAPWAGRVAPGLWIESFSVRPLEALGASELEYKALTGSGFETPWLSEDKMCGTKGMAVPLVGFALRIKPGAAGAGYDCEYSGYFQSGVTVGPLRNGAPCRSTVANDPLEGVQVRLLKRAADGVPEHAQVKTPRRSKGRTRSAAAASSPHPQPPAGIPPQSPRRR
jgi:GT2 family glycosyltransferase